MNYKNLKIDVFDKESGKAKALSKIVGELAPKLEGLNDRGVSKLINQFGGNEGLRALMTEIATGGNEMVQMFQDFDNSKFNIDDAFSKARMDVNALSESLKNKLSVIMIKLGEKILPLVLKLMNKIDESMPTILSSIEGAISKIERAWNTVKPIYDLMLKISKPIKDFQMGVVKKGFGAVENSVNRTNELVDNKAFLKGIDLKSIKGMRRGRKNSNILDLAENNSQLKSLVYGSTKARELAAKGDEVGALVSARKNLEASGIKSAEAQIMIAELNKRVEALMKKEASEHGQTSALNTDGSPSLNREASPEENPTNQNIPSFDFGSEMSSVVGSGPSTKNFTVNINQLVGEIKNIVEEGKADFQDIKEMVEQALITAVRDVELTVASD